MYIIALCDKMIGKVMVYAILYSVSQTSQALKVDCTTLNIASSIGAPSKAHTKHVLGHQCAQSFLLPLGIFGMSLAQVLSYIP